MIHQCHRRTEGELKSDDTGGKPVRQVNAAEKRTTSELENVWILFFSQTERGSTWSGGSSGHENTWDSPYFSARAANSTFGSSSVVQPASIRLMLCIKI